jgi:hypothetical protein
MAIYEAGEMYLLTIYLLYKKGISENEVLKNRE